MAKLIRLDKYLADMRIGTRKEVKKYIKNGIVKINNEKTTDAGVKVNLEKDEVYFKGNLIKYSEYIYIMLNKPAGVVSATKDNIDKTVVDLIEKKYRKDLFPVGRLDKDTEGLLILTNDGRLAHELLSPKKKVPKTYFAIVGGRVTESEIEKFRKGIKISEDFTALPAELEILESDVTSKVNLTIYEGKFHQVKRMFRALDMEVEYLKRISMGNLSLDSSLKLGEYRHLKVEELEML